MITYVRVVRYDVEHVSCPSTGASKGYGFVMYASKESAFHAKGLLDGKVLGGSAIICDWVDPTHTTVRSAAPSLPQRPPRPHFTDSLSLSL